MRILLRSLLLLASLGLLSLAGQAAVKTETFRFSNPIGHSAFQWPRTMLSYPMTFAPGQARFLALSDADGHAVPFQITDALWRDGALIRGTVNFISDLPKGATRAFTLSYSDQPLQEAPATAPIKVSVQQRGEFPVLSTGRVAAMLPPQNQKAFAGVPGPVLKVLCDGHEYGTSTLKFAKPVKAWSVTQTEKGDLVAAFRVQYDFVDGSTYAVTVRAAAEMPFIDFIEEGDGVGASLDNYWSLDLSDMQATEKFNQFAGDGLGTRWEAVGNTLRPGTGEWEFRLAPFYPKDNRYRHQAIGVRNADTVVGLSVRHNERWIDDRYALWAADRYTGAYGFTQDGKVSFRFPIANGRQCMAITAYPAAQGHMPLINNDVWYEILDLDRVKDEVFTWDEKPAAHEPVFEPGARAITKAGDFYASIEGKKNGFTGWLREGFTNGGGAKNPSQADRDLKGTIRQLDASLTASTGEDLAAIQASAALMAYLHAGDSYYPDGFMLGGHPNFMGDAKTPPGVFAAVLPNHPDANLWRDHSERAMELLLRYHTRPTVETWQAQGGRWTENPSCYLRHCLSAWADCFAAMRYHGDGRNIFAKPHADELGNYMVNLLTAPYNGQRVITQQGAHSGDICPPGEPYEILGLALRDYAPLEAENLIWASRIGETTPPGNLAGVLGTADALKTMADGTPPLLESQKFTGYGITMRQGVGTADELFLNLQQIDAGPNYRWGRAGDGGNGCIYFYAGGKRYTAHGGEDVGDASKTDTEATTNFGVWRDKSSGISRFKEAGQREQDRQDREGMFYSVGLRELTEPFYPFQTAQYARILANPDYAGPDYRARGVILVGGDYFLVHDEVTNPQAEGRFSWSIHEKDSFPQIQQLKPGVAFTERRDLGDRRGGTAYLRHFYTGTGEFLTLVSHKTGFTAKATPFGAEVTYDGGRDLIFTGLKPITYDDGQVKFSGTAGVVRLPKNGDPEVAIFGAGSVTVSCITITTTGDAGVSGRITGVAQVMGECFAQAGGTFTVTSSTKIPVPVWVDGTRVNGDTVTVAPGRHIWQKELSAIPPRPSILRTGNGKGEYTVYWAPVAGAERYRVEMQTAGAWRTVADNVTAGEARLKLTEPGKVFVRLIALNGKQESAPSAIYPIYVGAEPSRAPDGLKVDLYANPPRVFWGQVLGAQEYVLQRRVKGETQWTEVYRGTNTSYTDPRLAEQVISSKSKDQLPVYEYQIGAFNGNGGTFNPLVRNSDPTAYINIDPRPGERFRRQIETYESYGGAYDGWREANLPVLDAYPR